MVAVVIGMAVMAILITAIVPSVGTIMKREREQELIFRGKQYARAIAVFQKRFGRYPNELKELYENKPRAIRKLFKDPMCNCLDWEVIHPGQPDAIRPGAPGQPGQPRALPTPTPGVFGPAAGEKSVGPIIGVRSKVHKEALAEWRGQKFYDEWRFIMGDADRDLGPIGAGGFNPNTLRTGPSVPVGPQPTPFRGRP